VSVVLANIGKGFAVTSQPTHFWVVFGGGGEGEALNQLHLFQYPQDVIRLPIPREEIVDVVDTFGGRLSRMSAR
jgi:hypothetical protein